MFSIPSIRINALTWTPDFPQQRRCEGSSSRLADHLQLGHSPALAALHSPLSQDQEQGAQEALAASGCRRASGSPGPHCQTRAVIRQVGLDGTHLRGDSQIRVEPIDDRSAGSLIHLPSPVAHCVYPLTYRGSPGHPPAERYPGGFPGTVPKSCPSGCPRCHHLSQPKPTPANTSKARQLLKSPGLPCHSLRLLRLLLPSPVFSRFALKGRCSTY